MHLASLAYLRLPRAQSPPRPKLPPALNCHSHRPNCSTQLNSTPSWMPRVLLRRRSAAWYGGSTSARRARRIQHGCTARCSLRMPARGWVSCSIGPLNESPRRLLLVGSSPSQGIPRRRTCRVRRTVATEHLVVCHYSCVPAYSVYISALPPVLPPLLPFCFSICTIPRSQYRYHCPLVFITGPSPPSPPSPPPPKNQSINQSAHRHHSHVSHHTPRPPRHPHPLLHRPSLPLLPLLPDPPTSLTLKIRGMPPPKKKTPSRPTQLTPS